MELEQLDIHMQKGKKLTLIHTLHHMQKYTQNKS